MTSAVLCTNLSGSVRLSHLTDLFSACGQIVNSEIEGEGNPHARCLLQFGDASAASMAEMLDGTPLGDMAMRVQSVSYTALKEAPPLQTPISISQAPQGQSSTSGTTQSSSEPVVFTQDDRLLRTIYVGNLSPTVLTEHVIGFLAPIGAAIINIKMCPGGGSATAHAFVEFGCVRHAQMALSLSGTELHGRNVKVGMAENPIQAAGEGTADLRKRELALEKVRLAQERLKMKAMGLAPKGDDTPKDTDKDSKDRGKSRSRSRSRSKRRHRSSSRRSRSRDRHRRHRRHHRSRSRSRSRRRSKSRSRSMPRFSSARSLNYSRPSGRKKQAVQPANMIWDGFQWIPKPPQMIQQQQPETTANAQGGTT